MKEFQDKKTKVVYIVNTKTIEEVFKKDPRYVEITKDKPNTKKGDKKGKKDKENDDLNTTENPDDNQDNQE